MASMSHKEAKAWAEALEEEWVAKYKETGKAAHPPFDGLVETIHEDGTVLSFKSAWPVRYMVEEWDDDFR